MKWIKFDPAAFLEGVIGLNAKERGFYATLICLLYARDGNDVRDELVCKAMACNPRTWRAVKKRLISKGKIWCKDGHLMAKRVEWALNEARIYAERQSNRARMKREKEVGINKNKGLQMPFGSLPTTTTTTSTDSTSSLRSEVESFSRARAQGSDFNNSKEEKKAWSPNWRQSPSWRPRIDDEERSPPRTKSDNVLVPISDRTTNKR